MFILSDSSTYIRCLLVRGSKNKNSVKTKRFEERIPQNVIENIKRKCDISIYGNENRDANIFFHITNKHKALRNSARFEIKTLLKIFCAIRKWNCYSGVC